MNELRIPKRRVEVEVVLVDGTTSRMAFFLADAASAHPGPERIADLLNEPAAFLPAAAGERIAFVRRGAIACVRVDGAEAEPAETISPLATELAIAIELVGGRRVAGRVRFSLPPERCRLVDFLEAAPAFFRLEEGASVTFVNKGHVARVTLQGD